MSRKRHFNNNLVDYDPHQELDLPKQQWHQQILSLVNVISENLPRVAQDGGLYVGAAGVAYMLYYVSCYEPFSAFKGNYLQTAKAILERDLPFTEKHSRKPADKVSFILGPTGLYTIGALVGKQMHNDNMVQENLYKFKAAAMECTKTNFLACGSDELFVGRAGYLSGALALEQRLGIKVLDEATLNSICRAMITSGTDYARRHGSQSPLMYAYYETEYLGAAHGLASIIQMLLSCPSFLTSDPHSAEKLRATVEWVLSIQQPDGNFAPATDELARPRPAGEQLVHWCHGAPGVVYLLAKAYKVWGDERYLQACLKCGELTWKKGLLTKGPGICHGVAGSGYVFLLLYRLTKDKKHLHRAIQFANFIMTPEFQAGARTPDNPYSLYEGLAGTVCFMLDLLQPEKAEFPLFNVF